MIIVKVEGMDKLAKVIRAPSEDLRKQQRALMHQAVILVATEARARVYSRSGKAKRGIRGDVLGAGASLRGVVRPRNKSAIFSQRTREPGKTRPPIKAMMRLLRNSGAVATKAAAFLLARTIGRRGTIGRPIMVPALEAKTAEIIALWADRIARVLRQK